MCERACVHKVPPCKCLIVCVGNNSPIPQGMKQARKRPGPQTSRDPQGTGPPGETPQGQPRPPPRKGQRRARRRDLRQPQCRRPRVPWRQARRLHRQPTTPGRTGPKVDFCSSTLYLFNSCFRLCYRSDALAYCSALCSLFLFFSQISLRF